MHFSVMSCDVTCLCLKSINFSLRIMRCDLHVINVWCPVAGRPVRMSTEVLNSCINIY